MIAWLLLAELPSLHLTSKSSNSMIVSLGREPRDGTMASLGEVMNHLQVITSIWYAESQSFPKRPLAAYLRQQAE